MKPLPWIRTSEGVTIYFGYADNREKINRERITVGDQIVFDSLEGMNSFVDIIPCKATEMPYPD